MTATTHARGTTNGNARGGSDSRRRRREWLVETYRADRDLVRVERHYTDDTIDSFEVDNLPHHPMAGQSRRSMVEDHLAGYRAESGSRMGVEHDHTEAWLVPACRCYRCGKLLSADTVTVDRIIPGCQGGTYRRNNIRPACGHCNSQTGGAVRSTR